MTQPDFQLLDATDLSDVFESLVQDSPVLSSLVGGPTIDVSDVNGKFQWRNRVLTPRTYTVNGAYTAADGKIIFDSATGLMVGDMLKFEQATGESYDVVMRVTELDPDGDNANEVAVAIMGGNGNDEDVADNAVATFIGRARPEIEDVVDTATQEGSLMYNYTQKIKYDTKISYRSANSKDQFNEDLQDEKNYQALIHFQRELNNMVIKGVRDNFTISGDDHYTSGGIYDMIKLAAGNNILSSISGGNRQDFDQALFRTMIDRAIAEGAERIDALVMHPVQAIKMAPIIGDKVQYVQSEEEAGTRVDRLKSPILYKNINVANIVVDPNFDKDKILGVDSSRVGFAVQAPLAGGRVQNGSDASIYRWQTLVGLRVQDAGSAHVLMRDLKVS